MSKELCKECSHENCKCEEKKPAVKRNVTINFDENNGSIEESNYILKDNKKALAILGAATVLLGVTGGILYLAKNKK